jgi:hypothetical protein
MRSEPRGSDKQYFPDNIWIPYYGKFSMYFLKEGMKVLDLSVCMSKHRFLDVKLHSKYYFKV